ncbi:MAG: 2-oxoacid:ferredoxin oxidoreductase subunit alpha [Nitrososphaerota archaeon]|nr:2-oxoacid:acceptor oxidoreductase subunit alpha [Candidatus Calditenuaceae archaeon]MDW8073087.1 2-oxoacid:ferredoxin oxidoreductase subunit alpha [Nitrososphaerota archaeon]
MHEPKKKFVFSWMIGGAQGSGVDSSANLFAYSIASAGYYVFGKREYYSNIKGEHSYFNVVASDSQVRSTVDNVHLLASFDAETVFRHAWEVEEGGGIVFDATLENERLRNIPTIEERVKEDIAQRLKNDSLGETLGDVLESARRRGVRLYPIPYMDLIKKTGEILGEKQLTLLMRMVNTMAVAASFAIIGADINRLHRGLSYAFRAKRAVVDMNFTACKVVYDYFKSNFPDDFPIRVPNRQLSEDLILVNGTTIVGIAKIVAGCRVQTYYPITPAADESVYLEDKQVFSLNATSDGDEYEYPHLAENKELSDKGHILVFQSEDELAAIDMAIGASLAGVRAATSTSGPGFSLMVEGLGWAGMNEVPVVITIYQRGGPSTGLPTRHEQGDLLFTVFAGHGEIPRIVMASGDMLEAFYDTIKAFNYAEKFQVPVVHLLDKSLANSTHTIPVPALDDVLLDRGLLINEHLDGKTYKRFQFTETGISPRVPLGTRGGIFWNTGDEHDELGHISEDPIIRTKMMDKRMSKLQVIRESIPPNEKVAIYGDSDAKDWIVSWGSTKGPILDALEMLEEEGYSSIGFMQFKILYPFPSELALETLQGARRIIDVEQNYSGQMGKLMAMEAGLRPTNLVVKYNGRPFTSTEVRDGLKEVLSRNIKRIVMNRGG